jgi:hypothetical protein
MRKFAVDWGQVMLLEERSVNQDGVGMKIEKDSEWKQDVGLITSCNTTIKNFKIHNLL